MKIHITMAPLLILPFLLLLISPSVQAQTNISLGSFLTTQGPNTSWLSPSGDFAFGLRQVEGNSSAYLLAVWFHKISSQTVAWYAKTNGGELVQVLSGSRLLLTANGSLSLQDPTGTEVWNPEVVGAVHANMLDTGNFVLAGAGGSKLWETFRYPADTILVTQALTPGMTLRSRIIPTDYSNGRFLLKLESNYAALYLVAVPFGNEYDYYWSMIGNITNLMFDTTGRLYITTNSTQNNLTSAAISSMGDYYHRATLDPDGVFRQYVYPKKASNQSSQPWSVLGMVPDNICQARFVNLGSGTCGFNSYCMLDGTNNQSTCFCPPQYSFIDEERKYKGCKPDFLPQSCDLDEEAASMQFEFKSMNQVDWPLADYEQSTPVNKDDCQKLCLTDCFCAVAVYQEATGNCWRKKMPLSNGNKGDNVDRTVFFKVSKNNNSQSLFNDSSKWKKDKKYWILGSSLFLGSSVFVNLLLISVILFGSYCTVIKKGVPTLQSSTKLGLPLKVFTYEELEDATSGFKEVLGTGASGIVYKGQLKDDHSTFIAVKKIDKLEHETEKEFTVEVETIGRTHHKNLVRLLGFCNEGKERLLVYEFMTNGSLKSFLFGDDVRLPWSLRAQLALGVARGLLYLHEECSTQIIHCDIKPENILLDENMTAKISDFGLAKLLRTKQTQTNTGIRGTRGYVAPEWFRNIGITAKVDVYSFGVILLELICCRRNVEMDVADEDRKILSYWAMDCYRCGRVDFLVEGDDEATMNLKQVERLVEVALWCLQEDPAIRPTMRMVTQMLDGTAAIQAPPDPPSFVSSIS